eukprot:CAMPEP_0116146026 /NCGR_PEP_ID=MMETSP0329-20121206/16936_1 /TAXON_ID=697910 /ORGANISM="Pseudo-nitzschia arenysensis, Strain B593" /LENGTH=775 /DNA_ID=CAMNT_0003641729 /DNA_START=94 /DNA_END=2421 /DNA_ORIENTATION=+
MASLVSSERDPRVFPTEIFHAVVEENYQGLANIFAENARNSVASYLSMKTRWARRQDFMAKSEEKIDEFLQHPSHSRLSERHVRSLFSTKENDASDFHYVLEQLSGFINEQNFGTEASSSFVSNSDFHHGPRSVYRLVWEACSALADSRPPSNLCIYDRSGAKTPLEGRENDPPIFDGSVANATPAPHGGGGAASGGTGTILHLVCAMDRPLMLAFFLIMGADGRANHTAFRRLMIHEAACNGSINCLTLLLEMGQKYAKEIDEKNKSSVESNAVPFLPDAMDRSSIPSPRLATRPQPPISINLRHFGRATHTVGKSNDDEKVKSANCMPILCQFKSLAKSVKEGSLTELEAARSLLARALLTQTTRTALIRSCSFRNDTLYTSHSFLRPFGCADGHGNTPLHWASFKNETECVALLLEYNADPNARAHPSGWTPLHDAAYSNSSECIALLSAKGAQIDAKANSGATPLCFASQEDASEAARFLLDRGADLSSRCAGPPPDDGAQYHFQLPNHPHSRFSGYTPLHYCAHYNAQRASQVLLSHPKAKIAMEVPDLSGRLPIHVAVARGSSDVLRALLHAGARVNTPPTASPTSVVRPSPAVQPNFGLLPAAARGGTDEPASPNRSLSTSTSSSPVTSPVLRSMIPTQPISSSKPWNCLSQRAIDECKELILKSEQSWSPEHHLLFTPQDRKAVMELLRVGKRLEQNGTGIFIDLWPTVLSFCGRGWFETEESQFPLAESMKAIEEAADDKRVSSNENAGSAPLDQNSYLALPSLSD